MIDSFFFSFHKLFQVVLCGDPDKERKCLVEYSRDHNEVFADKPIFLKMSDKGNISKRNLAFALLGLPSWSLIDVTWSMVSSSLIMCYFVDHRIYGCCVQLSQLADRVPEGYNISAYLILSLTFGNIIPLVANSTLKSYSHSSLRKLIGCILVVGCACGVSACKLFRLPFLRSHYTTQVAMAVMWHITVSIGGHAHSLPFCLLFFIVGACASTSNVTHYTYVSVFPSNETTALSTGMALGSMLAGALALLQGTVLGSLGMSVGSSYIAVASLYVPALFLVWTDHPLIESASTALKQRITDEQGDKGKSTLLASPQTSEGGGEDWDPEVSQRSEDSSPPAEMEKRDYNSLLVLHLFNCAMGYGVVPSMISPVCSRVSSSSLVLLLATGLFSLLDPLCRAGTALRPVRTLQGLRRLSTSLYVLAAALLATLVLPESSGLLAGPVGGVYVVTLYVGKCCRQQPALDICFLNSTMLCVPLPGFGVTFGFTNLCVFLYIKTHTPPNMVQVSHHTPMLAVCNTSEFLDSTLLTCFLSKCGVAGRLSVDWYHVASRRIVWVHRFFSACRVGGHILNTSFLYMLWVLS